VRFEVLTVVKMMMLFWVVTPCRLRAEDGDSMFLRNDGIYLQVHTVSQPRTTSSNLLLAGSASLNACK
jgi:hypothetical protein